MTQEICHILPDPRTSVLIFCRPAQIISWNPLSRTIPQANLDRDQGQGKLRGKKRCKFPFTLLITAKIVVRPKSQRSINLLNPVFLRSSLANIGMKTKFLNLKRNANKKKTTRSSKWRNKSQNSKIRCFWITNSARNKLKILLAGPPSRVISCVQAFKSAENR